MRRLVALALTSCAAVGVAGCGDSGANLLSSADAGSLKDTLGEVRQAVDDRDVAACRARIRQLRGEIGNLPGTVDRELRQRLREEVVTKLEPEVTKECAAPKTEQLPTVTSPTPTVPSVPATTTQAPPTPTTTAPPTDTTGTVPDTTSTAIPPTATAAPEEPVEPDDGTGGVSPDGTITP